MKNLVIKTLSIGIPLLMLFFLYTKFVGPIPFTITSVQTTKSNMFQVSGTGKVSEAPDTAQVSFGVTQTAKSVANAQNQTNTAISAITSALAKEGINTKDIKTTNYTVSPNYDFNGRQAITGYTVTQTIDLKIKPIEKVNTVLDILITSGANVVNQVIFTFSDDKRHELENKARELAVKDAKQKAQSLAQAAGIHLGQIIDVTQANDEEPRPVMPMLAKDAAVGTTPTQVTPGENTISLTVTLSYQTY